MALLPCRECGKEVSTEAEACPACGDKVIASPKKSKMKSRLFGLFVILSGVIALVQITTGPTDPKPTAQKHTDAADLVKVIRFEARKGGFDNVMIATFTVKNNNPFPVKDMQIVCGHFAPSGTELPASVATLYERIESGQTRTFKNINLGIIPTQSSKYDCTIAVAKKITPQ